MRAGHRRAPPRRRSPDSVGIDVYDAGYRATKARPDPFLEFCLGWIARNPVDTHGREAPVVWDSGQFHHEDGRVTAILDLELGHLGDPMMDLAAFRMRDTVLGFGDMNVLYDQYAKHAGAPVDLDAIMHHHFVFTLTNQMVVPRRARRTAGRVRLHDQHAVGERDQPLRARRRSPRSSGVDDLDTGRDARAASTHRSRTRTSTSCVRCAASTSPTSTSATSCASRSGSRRHLQRFDEIGDACTEADLDDLQAFLGRRPTTWQEGDAALEEFVLADDGAHDEELLQLFHRRYLRYKMLCGPAGSAMARHEPIQKFRS